MTRVLVFGVFDFFHPGHLGFLRMAASQGDELIVSVARDVFVASFKKKRPMFTEQERRDRIAALDFVYRVVLSDERPGNYTVIGKYRPDIICFGHDQHALQEHCEHWLAENGLAIRTKRLDHVKHIKKDFAFLFLDAKTLEKENAFAFLPDRFADRIDGNSFRVYNRSGELKAVICRCVRPDDADIAVFFEYNRKRRETDDTLLCETAWFIKYLAGTDAGSFFLDF
ncbi:MAG: adenylyltransferase/cytidyltransferase family protein, partial [Spirochaetales bacterium]|nr:adenylyltransferase/cytidyltransferase family protein [Spirochaetales bacterium]